MTEPTPFSCTLSPEDAARRRTRDRSLADRLISHHWDGPRGAVLTFPAEATPLVTRFVRDESTCCSFFDFEVDAGGDQVRLRVEAPAGAEPMLRQLVSAFAA